MSETAVAVREEQHPIIAKIDDRMPEIAQMLPDGMRADRFRKVVVQALVRNPDLWQCTPVSVVSAIVESAQIGLEPTGVLGRAWMLPYNTKQPDGSWRKEAKLIVGYRGYAELAWRADRILVTTGAVREGDEFSYQRGTGKFLRHVPASDDPEREADDANITDFWAMYTLPDGREDFDVMSRVAVERIRERAKYKNPVWESDFGEMGRKTVLRRLLKVAPLSPEVQRVLASDEEIDYDTPVERVPDPKRAALRDRIAQRSAAIRGDSTGASEGSTLDGAAGGTDTPVGSQPEGDGEGSPLPSGGSPAKAGDPWMRRLHAVGAERGMDHDALHDWAVEHFRAESLSDLTTPQRATFMELVERMEVMPQPGREPVGARAAEPAPVDPDEVQGDSSVVSESPPIPPRAVAPAPTLDDVLAAAGPGAEIVPPKPRTPEYGALTPPEKASARAYWAQKEAEAKERPDAEAMKAAVE